MDRKPVHVQPGRPAGARPEVRPPAHEPRASEVGLRWRFALALSDAAARRRAERRG